MLALNDAPAGAANLCVARGSHAKMKEVTAALSEAEQAELVSQAADTRIKLVPYVRPKLDVTEWDTMVLRDGDCVVCAQQPPPTPAQLLECNQSLLQ